MGNGFLPASGLISAIGGDAIMIQRKWNQYHEESVLHYQRILKAVPLEIGKFTQYPERQVLDTISIEFRACVAATREGSAQVSLKPLNMSYDLLFGGTAESESRIKITAEQIPTQVNQNRDPN